MENTTMVIDIDHMKIEKATQKDCGEVTKLYDSITEYLAEHTNYPGWRKGIYPSAEDAEAGIQGKVLYTAKANGKIVGTFILRNTPEEAYNTVDWKGETDYGKIFVLHTFAVHPDYLKFGIGEKMLRFIIELSQTMGIKEIRLDVYEKNLPAMRLYEKCGFCYVGKVDLGHADIGLNYFNLYQYRV